MAFLVLTCGRSFEEVGRMTVPQAQLLCEEYVYQHPVFQLMDFAHRLLARGKPLFEARVSAHGVEKASPGLIDALLGSPAGRAALEEKGCVLPSEES